MPGALTRWDPFAEFADLRRRFDRLFGDAGERWERGWTPAIDVVREEGDLLLRADIPGMKPEEVRIEIEDDVLTVSGEHEEREEDKHKDYIRRERRFGSFSRSMAIPSGVDVKETRPKPTTACSRCASRFRRRPPPRRRSRSPRPPADRAPRGRSAARTHPPDARTEWTD